MRFRFIVALLFAQLFLFTGCKSQHLSLGHVRESFEIDGIAEQLDASSTWYGEDQNIRLAFSVAENQSQLYLCLKTNDRRAAMLLERRGFRIWLNSRGENRKILGIEYRHGSVLDRKNLQPQAGAMSVPAFKPAGFFHVVSGENEYQAESVDSYGILAAAGEEDGVYAFEVTVPLPSEKNSSVFFPDGITTPFKIGLELLPMSETEKNMREKMNQKRQEGMRMRPGGGMRSGRMGGRPNMNGGRGIPFPEGKEIWISVD